jgi:hypothetical protein
MADECLPCDIKDREFEKFTCDGDEVAVRTKGSISPAGLSNAGRITLVELVETEWRAVPPTPLANRNGISLQNFETGANILLEYDNTAPASKGVNLVDNAERFYTITDGIIIYARTKPGGGTVNLIVEELS